MGEASESATLLAQAIKDYQGLLRAYSAPDERQDWARAQGKLGAALILQGDRSTGAQATDSLAQAVAAFRAALEVESKADTPKDWGRSLESRNAKQRDRGNGSASPRSTSLSISA